MSRGEPHRWALAAVEVATSILPPGPVRSRYRSELRAELWGMPLGAQLVHAVSVLAGAPSLRRALFEAGELEFPHSPHWCQGRLHHVWQMRVTEDGTRYRRCRACGSDDDETTRRRTAGSRINAHGVIPG